MKIVKAVGVFCVGFIAGYLSCPVKVVSKIEPVKVKEEPKALRSKCRDCKYDMCTFEKYMKCGSDRKLFEQKEVNKK